MIPRDKATPLLGEIAQDRSSRETPENSLQLRSLIYYYFQTL